MKKRLSRLFSPVLFLLTTGSSQAITLSFDPATQDIPVGSPVDVALVISGLGDGTAPSLGDFDLDVSFDPAVLTFTDIMFSSLLGDPLLGEAIADFDNSVPGIVNLFEVSLLDADSTTCIFCIPPFLDELQLASFTLSTLRFNTLSAGSSPLDISINALGDGFGDPLTADVQSASITSLSTSVPEPSSLLLLGTGLLGLGRLRGSLLGRAARWTGRSPG